MTSDPLVFRDLAYVFAAAVLGGGLAWLARQPLILGYVVGGILVSPLTPGPSVSDVHTFEVFAEIGVVLLMFTIGVEFSLADLLRVRRVALLGGPLGILLSVGLGLAVGTLLGWRPLQGSVVGIVVSVASTMVLAQLLLDRGELHTRHGRVMIGITLVEDLAVVVLTVLMPALGALEPGRLGAIGLALLRAAAILVPFWLLAARVMPQVLTWIARTRSPELFLLVALSIALGTAALTQALGLSLAVGAFLAGLLVSESDYAHETLARMLSLRDAFVALFFVTLGALIDPRLLLENLRLLAVMLGLVLVGKPVLWTAVVALFGYPLRTALLVGVGLTQIGEFSFLLVQAARAAGHVGADVYNATLATALLTILANAVLVRLVPRGLDRAALGRAARIAAPEAAATPRVVVCGFGRIGSAVGEALETFGVPFVVLETDPDVVRGLRARGVPCLYGDAAHPRLLQAAGAARAPLVVVALPDGRACPPRRRARPADEPGRADPGACPPPGGPGVPAGGGRHGGRAARDGGGRGPDPPRAGVPGAPGVPAGRLPGPVPRRDDAHGGARRARRGAPRGARGRPRPGAARGRVPPRRRHPRALRHDRGGDHARGRRVHREPTRGHRPPSGGSPAGLRSARPDPRPRRGGGRWRRGAGGPRRGRPARRGPAGGRRGGSASAVTPRAPGRCAARGSARRARVRAERGPRPDALY
jgi:CPA2 family monovalent cation:H+ antiporter-2